MRLWLPADPGQVISAEAMSEIAAAAMPANYAPREVPGIVVAFRFLHELPAGPLAVRPALPEEPAVPFLAYVWCNALEGRLWASRGLVVAVTARREWSRVTGIEVTL